MPEVLKVRLNQLLPVFMRDPILSAKKVHKMPVVSKKKIEYLLNNYIILRIKPVFIKYFFINVCFNISNSLFGLIYSHTDHRISETTVMKAEIWP